MKRERIIIKKETLRELIYKKHTTIENYKCVENIITSSDEEDGGANHDIIVKRLSDGRFFKMSYTDWDMKYNFESDFSEELIEVFPKQITTTVYE